MIRSSSFIRNSLKRFNSTPNLSIFFNRNNYKNDWNSTIIDKFQTRSYSQEPPKIEFKEKKESYLMSTIMNVGAVSLLFIGFVNYFGQPTKEDQGTSIIDYLKRSIIKPIGETWRSLKEPVTRKLLPDPQPEPYQPNYTLVFNLYDLLIKLEYEPANGWK